MTLNIYRQEIERNYWLRFHLRKYSVIASLAAILITGIPIYLILDYFLIPIKFALSISAVISILSFGLTRYYSKSHKNFDSEDNNDPLRRGAESRNLDRDQTSMEKYTPNMIFSLIYLIFVILVLSFSESNLNIIFLPWHSFELYSAIGLCIGILLVYFMPGYAIITLLTTNDRINSILKLLLSYLSSMLISGLTIYFSSLYPGSGISEFRNLIICLNLAVLLAFIVCSRTYRLIFIVYRNYHRILNYIIIDIGNKLRAIKVNINELLVFGSIFGLLIVYMYFVYGGITIGDQWYHQNRAILMMSGQFKESVLSNSDDIYTPFQSALLAAVTVISGTPLVNAYVSIAFLNVSAVLAFYYFILMWLPTNTKRAALIAASLFVIASGFDWTYVLYSTVTNSILSQFSSVAAFFQEQIRSSDIIYSPNFVIAAFPDFNTGLIYISLPSGFVLLGLICFKMKNRFSYTGIITIITILGIFSHPEFYLFIIISSILPVIFSMKEKSSIYLALLFAFAFAYMADTLLPIHYFTGNEILGMPLINLATTAVLVTWIAYAIRQYLSKFHYLISHLKMGFGRKLKNITNRTNFISKVVIVWIIVYLYAFSFVVWTQLPSIYIDVQRDGKTTPWYFYPMRLGLVGLIGLAFIFSYIFKRFEKQVFIFGIIMIVAFLVGPFYDEQRMTKYIMAGVIGFASLFIYKLLAFAAKKNLAFDGIIIAIVVLTVSLSTIMFVAYNAQIIETQDYSHALGRRNFPSMQEMNMLDLMRSKLQAGSNTTNIAGLPYEYNPWEGYLITKLHGFSGLPLPKTFPNSLVLNASTMESFYNLLDSSGTKYIIIPTNSIYDGILSYPSKFALENFHRIYNDDNYQVLEVPLLRGPTTGSNVSAGIIYGTNEPIPVKMDNSTNLRYDNNTFVFNNKIYDDVSVNTIGGIEKITLNSNNTKSHLTLWSKNIDTSRSINYIETRFRILDENKIGDVSGLKWSDNGKDYFLYISDEGLTLGRQSGKNATSFLFTNTAVEKNNWKSYQIAVASLENSINVYIDNILKIKIPKLPEDKDPQGISKVAIYCANNTVEFEPISIAKIPSSENFYDKAMKNDYYYPLSAIALSGIEYDSFKHDDFSALTKKAIILPFDSINLNETLFRKYIDYVKSGGDLIVMNSQENFNGKFSKLFSIETSPNKTKFSNLNLDNASSFIKVSGMVKNIRLKPSSDTVVTASYVDKNNNTVAPLTIERHFPNGGKIILINSKGYFDAIYNKPTKYFLSLKDFAKIFDLPSNDRNIDTDVSSQKIKYHFIGDTKLSGKISIKSNSISIINESKSSVNMDVQEISIYDNKSNQETHFKNVSVYHMNLYGGSEISLNTTGNITLPLQESYYDYVSMSIPNNFNMTIRISDDSNSRAQIDMNNNSMDNHIEINGGSIIKFHNVSNPIPKLISLPVQIKSPEIIVFGNASFDNTYYFGQMARIKDTSLHFSGKLKMKIDFTDQYNERYSEGIRTQDITYIVLTPIDGKTITEKNEIKLPGDISISAKQQALIVPIFDIFTSPTNFVVLGLLTLVTIIVSWLLRTKR